MKQINDTVCFECDCSENIQQHHVVPKVKGGTMTIPLCETCHSKVHGKHMLKMQRLAAEGVRKKRRMIEELGLPNPFGRPTGTKESFDKFLSKPKNKKILSLLKEGMTYEEIQEIVKCSPKTIAKVLKYSGVSIQEYSENRIKKERKKKQINVLCVYGKYIGQIRSIEEWEKIVNVEKGKILSHIKKTRYKNGIDGNFFKLESDCKESIQLSIMMDY